MREDACAQIERARRCDAGAGPYRTKPFDRFAGLFDFQFVSGGPAFRVLWSAGRGWEHCSVSLANRTPTWEEMDRIKSFFWGDDEVVIQFHIGGKNKVNMHPYCLHMWRPTGAAIPTPPADLV